jgi:hypothetical protein
VSGWLDGWKQRSVFRLVLLKVKTRKLSRERGKDGWCAGVPRQATVCRVGWTALESISAVLLY